ncbi:MAG: TRAP transporter large permease subunit [Clostridia bacterium]|nr:TRAP transporter large permease subunit [Clostridia bacterium]
MLQNDDHSCCGPFGWALASRKIPQTTSAAVLSVFSNEYVILFLISVIVLIAGVFMETSSAIILLTPVFLPLTRIAKAVIPYQIGLIAVFLFIPGFIA